MSYINNLVHMIWSTKERKNTIPTELLPNLHRYLIATGKAFDVPLISVGGIENHVHLLAAVPSTLCVADIAQHLKANSSRWMKNEVPLFGWQEEYGAFSVSESNRNQVIAYIENQREHHKKISFEDEFIELLKRHNVDYDPRYLFR
jgi:REP element-mobilizing transposase RayT